MASLKEGQNSPSNPWLNIWIKPKQTIREVVNSDERKGFVSLCVIYGIPLALNVIQNLFIADTVPVWALLIAALVLSPFLGMAGIYVLSWLLHVSGRWIGGGATRAQVRAAVAWSNVPNVVSIVVWGALLLMFRGLVFGREFSQMPLVGYQAGILFLLMLIEMVASVWGFVLLLNTLAEVQKFSLWRAFFNVVIPFAAVVALFWVAGFIISSI